MLDPSSLSPRARRLAAGVIHRAWRWVSAVGTVSPDDRHGFRSLGAESMLGFPPGDVFGEWWIAIGSQTLIAPEVTLSVGMPGEVLDRAADVVLSIGDRCSVGRGTSIVARRRIEIGDDVTIAPNVYITDHNHAYADVDVPIKEQYPTHEPVRIGAGTWIAAGATVLPGADIGQHVTVGAGAVVRGIVPDYSVVAGNPARVVRHHDGTDWVPPLRKPPDEPPADWRR
ncbi:MAG TPA: acyltransferase [Acidimicrobiales bacterium]|nr:acyltransferase [Acidimicrobiales bacterium]